MFLFFLTGKPQHLLNLFSSFYCTLQKISGQKDSNPDFWKRRQVFWPLYHHHCPCYGSFFFLLTVFLLFLFLLDYLYFTFPLFAYFVHLSFFSVQSKSQQHNGATTQHHTLSQTRCLTLEKCRLCLTLWRSSRHFHSWSFSAQENV